MPSYCVMSLSFHGPLLRGELQFGRFCRDLQQAGLTALEPATSLFGGDLVEAELRSAVADAGLALPCYDALANLVHADSAPRQAALDSVRRDLDRCARWGIPLVMVAGSRKHAELSEAACRQQVAAGLNALVDEATARGQTLLLESFGADLQVHASSAQLADVVRQCDPRIMVTFDMGNYILGGDRPAAVVPAWLPRTRHVHVKDFARLPAGDPGGLPSHDGHRYTGCRLGTGAVDLAATVRALRDGGYAGAWSLEMSGADSLPQLAADLTVLRAAVEG
ncbi:MAG: sugar phosphate isomerase/epimerase [Fimbriimonadaceae bacterium]|nr:sugar phosphate isomerase/epimerase [Fimbriimonadaceae bacterium]